MFFLILHILKHLHINSTHSNLLCIKLNQKSNFKPFSSSCKCSFHPLNIQCMNDFKITFIQRPLSGQKEPYSADGTLETSVRVRLSTSVNVSSNNSLRAEAFALIMFEYVTFCFIRFYLLMPLPKMIAHCNLQGEKNIHIYCRTLTADCTLASLQKQNFRLSLKVKLFFPVRLDQQEFTLITAAVCNQATEAGQPITARDWEMGADVSCA